MRSKLMMMAGLGSALGIGAALLASAAMAPLASAAPAAKAAMSKPAACPGGDTGITLPPGFCATIFADNLGNTRHIVVAADGTLYANTWNGSSYFRGTTADPNGFLIAVEDSNHDGKADKVTHFGVTPAEGSKGSTRARSMPR
jgi:hypothetical protein